MTDKRETVQMVDIRQAILANRGGYGHCTDEELQRVWNSLPGHVRTKYLSKLPAKGKKESEKTE